MPPAFRTTPVQVRVPATSANLGPGFDAFGLALGLYDEVRVRLTGGGRLTVDVSGEGAGTVSRGGDNLVVRSLRAAFDALGGQPDGLAVTCTNRIPHGRGLGSSAAAICAGVVAARALLAEGDQRLDAAATLGLAAELEGHPDNVAACLAGGFTLAWTPAGVHGSAPGPVVPRSVRMEPSAQVAPVVFVPGFEVSTAKARGLLPPVVPHQDAAANAGRAALLLEALTRRPELLLEATEDRLHQAYRAPAMPASAALVDELRSAGVPAVVSGAGPTVLALPLRSATAGTVAEMTRVAGDGWTVHRLAVDLIGATVVKQVLGLVDQ